MLRDVERGASGREGIGEARQAPITSYGIGARTRFRSHFRFRDAERRNAKKNRREKQARLLQSRCEGTSAGLFYVVYMCSFQEMSIGHAGLEYSQSSAIVDKTQPFPIRPTQGKATTIKRGRALVVSRPLSRPSHASKTRLGDCQGRF